MIRNCNFFEKVKESIRRGLLMRLAAVLLLVVAGSTAWGQVKTTVKGMTTLARPTTLEVWGVQDASVSATPVERTSPNGERLYCAYDINIVKDGREWQPEPNEPAIVTMTDPNFIDGQLLDIYHEGKNELEYIATVAPENGKITFPAPSFSVYIITTTGDSARLKVTFHRASAPTEVTVYVKKADIGHGIFNEVVYNPGMGTPAAGVECKGWTANASYSVSDMASAITFTQIRDSITNRLNAGVTDGTELHFYTMLFKSYSISYLDEKGAVIHTDDTAYRADAGTPAIKREVNAAYTPDDNDHNFEGWKVNTHADGTHINGHSDDEHVYENGDSITIRGSITLKVYTTKGHWLIYHENGKGATYKAADFVRSNEVTERPTIDMRRNGYTFDNWYFGPLNANGNPTGGAFPFGNALDSNTNIYAKWIPQDNAPYTVIIWKQKVSGSGYDFAEAISLTGGVGTTIGTVNQQGTGNNAYARVNGVNKTYTGFHLDHFDSGVQIKTEGNSVVNVYYNRTSYTLTFRKNQNGTVYKTITALYEQSIGSNFPITTNGASADWRWKPQGSSTFSNVLVYIDAMPAENVTFYKDESSNSTKYMKFYVEARPGQTGTRTFNGRSFVQYGNTITAKYNYFTLAEDFVDISGYSKYGSDPAFGGNGRAYVDAGGTLYLYYIPLQYTINFMDGAYYDGNGERLTSEVSMGDLGTSPNIAYGYDISEYNNYHPATSPAGYVFEGWYTDATCSQPLPYNFTTMPKGGITVYAKWRQIQYRVFLHPGITAVRAPRLTWGSDNQAMNFRITYGGRISAPTGVDQDDNWKFVGWFTDSECTHPFNESSITLTDVNTTLYNKTTDLTDSMDIWGVIVNSSPYPEGTTGPGYNSDSYSYNRNTGTFSVRNRFWITRKYDLYGKWKATLPGAIGITVVYDGNGGTPTSDTAQYKYQDGVKAIANSACTPPSTTKEFSHWVMQRYNSSTNSFEDIPGSRIYPTDTFSVRKINAKRHIDQWCDPNNPSNTTVPSDPFSNTPPDGTHTLISKAVYTLMLRAEYVDVEQPKKTFIVWYKNDETHGIVRTDYETTTPHTLPLNMTVEEFNGRTPVIPTPESRSGYNFLGWYKQRTEPGNTVPTNVEQCAPNFLYYNNEDHKYYKEATFTTEVTKVAADTYQKDDYLYAIWVPIIDFALNPVCGGQTIQLPTRNSDGLEIEGSWSCELYPSSISGTYFTAPEDGGNIILKFTPGSTYPFSCLPPQEFPITVYPKPVASIATAASNPICPGADPMKIYGATTVTNANYTYTWNGGGLTLTGGGHTWDKTR